jgi:hypothetical protein
MGEHSVSRHHHEGHRPERRVGEREGPAIEAEGAAPAEHAGQEKLAKVYRKKWVITPQGMTAIGVNDDP